MLDIDTIISAGERHGMEAKKAGGGIPDSLWASYSAFANTDGGVILLGMSEENKTLKVCGVADAPRKIKNIWDTLNDRSKICANILLERHIYVQQVEGRDVVEKRPGKITISNPGIFRPNKEDILNGGVSDPRNPNIFKMFNLLDIGERAGSGLFNIRTIWQDEGWPAPVWEETFTPERLKLSIPVELELGEKVTENLEGGTEKRYKTDLKNVIDALILQTIEQESTITIPEMARRINKGLSATKARLAKLKQKGYIEHIGPDKGGRWRVKNEP